MRSLLLSLLCACSLAAQTPAKATPCDTAAVLLTARPIYDVGAKSIASACPAFSAAIDRWYVLHADTIAKWTPAQVVAAIAHGVRPVAPPPFVSPPTPLVIAPPAPKDPSPTPAPVPSTAQNPAGTGLLIGPLTAQNGITPAYPSSRYFTDYGAFTAIVDSTSPTGHALRASYKAGSEGGATLYAALGSSYSSLYSRMLYKVDANWPVGGTKKVLQYRQGFDQIDSILDIEGGKWHLFNALTGNWIAANAHAAYDPGALRGQWIDLGYLVEAVDATHMRHRVWVNGSLEIDATVSGATFSPSVVMFGGVFNSPAGNDTDWMVNNAVYTGATGI